MSSASIPAQVLAFVVGLAVNSAILGFGARRLVGLRFSVPRLLVAAAVGLVSVNPVLNDLASTLDQRHVEIGQAALLIILGWAVAVLIMLIVLVLAEAFLPSGSLPPLRFWPSLLRARARRSVRYLQISRIFVRHGLGSFLRYRSNALDADVARVSELPERLAAALEQAGPTFVKLGQVLSTRRDLLPGSYITALSRLQDRATPMPQAELDAVLHQELRAPLAACFRAFDYQPLACASIAQVHTATLLDGAEVVVKIQRPGAHDLIQRDLDIVKRLARAIEARTDWGRALGLKALADGFAAALREELDFRIEADNLTAVAAEARRDGSPVRTPEPFRELSTRRLLIMERIPGEPLSRVRHRLDERGLDRAALARTALDALLRQILLGGTFHADPHPGNVLLLPDGGLGLIDFGSVGQLDLPTRRALIRLLPALDKGDPLAAADALLEVIGRPDELDRGALERGLGELMARHLGPGATLDARLFSALIKVLARHGLAVPPQLAAVFRALGTLEGLLTDLSPGFDLVGSAREIATTLLGDQVTAEAVRREVTAEAVNLLPLLRGLPRRVDHLLDAAESGRFTVRIRLFADDHDRHVVNGLVQQLVLAVLAATCGLMATRLLGIAGGPTLTPAISLYQFLGYCLLVIAGILGLRLLAPIFRREA
jgi:ubiquinone biosynthesis protein